MLVIIETINNKYQNYKSKINIQNKTEKIKQKKIKQKKNDFI
jgi:hypothetical protein